MSWSRFEAKGDWLEISYPNVKQVPYCTIMDLFQRLFNLHVVGISCDPITDGQLFSTWCCSELD